METIEKNLSSGKNAERCAYVIFDCYKENEAIYAIYLDEEKAHEELRRTDDEADGFYMLTIPISE